MKKYILLIFVSLVSFIVKTNACDDSTISITGQTNNPDGTVTYNLDILVELGGGDGFYDGFFIRFDSPSNTPTITAFTPTAVIASSTAGVSEDLDGTISGNTLNYDNNTIYNAAFDDFVVSIQVTVDGCAETIYFDSHINSAAAACKITIPTGNNCAVCDISNLSIGNQTACVSGTNTYTQEVVITYSNPPAAGTLDVNGQSFPLGTSPQTVTLTNLTADGAAVNVSALFSADPTCTLTTNNLFTAPPNCSTSSCTANNGTWD